MDGDLRDRNVGTGKTLLPAHLLVNDGNGGNNYSYTYAPVTTGVINQIADGDGECQHQAL